MSFTAAAKPAASFRSAMISVTGPPKSTLRVPRLITVISWPAATPARTTARLMFPGKDLQESELIHEVPCRSAFDSKIRLPLWLWFLIGRLQWAAGSTRQPEKRRDTENRSRQFIENLCRDGADCAVVTHGFFMHILLRDLKKAGFRTDRSRLNFKHGEYVTAER